MTKFLGLFFLVVTTFLFGTEAYAQCTNCRPRATVQPVSRWSVPNQCQAPSLTSNHMSFTDPNNKCTFYECAANGARDQLGCNNGNNYFRDYGKKYCNRFVNSTYANLSTRGKRWMNEVLVCLQNALRNGCARDNRCRNCATMRRWAFDSHTPCYTGQDPFTRRRDSGRLSLCELSLVDQGYVGSTPDAADLATRDSARQIAEVAQICGADMARNTADAVVTTTNTVVGGARRLVGWD